MLLFQFHIMLSISIQLITKFTSPIYMFTVIKPYNIDIGENIWIFMSFRKVFYISIYTYKYL